MRKEWKERERVHEEINVYISVEVERLLHRTIYTYEKKNGLRVYQPIPVYLFSHSGIMF